MQFRKGQSGNPAGKPKGARDKRTELRALLMPHAPQLIDLCVQRALTGDPAAMRLCLDRLVAPIKATDTPIELPVLEGDASQKAQAILASLASGKLTPEQASSVLQAVAAYARIVEFAELERRIVELESRGWK